MPRLSPFARRAGLLALPLALAAPAVAHARGPNVKRKGGQVDGTVGVSLCTPSRNGCKIDEPGLTGRTAPNIGLGVNAGFRFNKFFFLGAGYGLGVMSPRYDADGADLYGAAVQQTVLLVPRVYLPVWRFDFGLEASPGWSRQTFRGREGDFDRQYTQGFAFRPGVSIDVWITKRIFVGVSGALILNGHRNHCEVTGNQTQCEKRSRSQRAGVHQSLVGLHIGGTFL